MAPNNAKKPVVLTLQTKSKILDELAQNKSVTNLARKYNVAKSTICSIKKKKEKILFAVSNTFSGPGKRKTLRDSELPETEQMLYRWFLEQRQKNNPISGLILKAKAKYFFNICNPNNELGFNASDGWLDNFKKRFGIRLLTISGEKLSSQHELVAPFKTKLHQKITELGLLPQQIYNADETGLFYKMLPRKTYVTAEEKNAPGRKAAKERVTFLACTNADGTHKLKPLIIGRSKNPRCFKNYSLPVEYKHSKTAWMSVPIFHDWFHKSFVVQVRNFFSFKNKLNKFSLYTLCRFENI